MRAGVMAYTLRKARSEPSVYGLDATIILIWAVRAIKTIETHSKTIKPPRLFIEKLLLEFPDESKSIRMGKNKGRGVALVLDTEKK